MEKITVFLLLNSFFLSKVYGLLGVIVYEEIEICGEEDEKAGVFDFSELDVFAETDEHVYLNGTWKFVKEVKSPWKAHVFTEKKIRGKWSIEILNKKIEDFCEVVQRPTEPWYHVTSNFDPKECPFPAGTEMHFKMQSLTDLPFAIPEGMEGEWRITFIGEFGYEDGKKECVRGRFDIVQV